MFISDGTKLSTEVDLMDFGIPHVSCILILDRTPMSEKDICALAHHTLQIGTEFKIQDSRPLADDCKTVRNTLLHTVPLRVCSWKVIDHF